MTTEANDVSIAWATNIFGALPMFCIRGACPRLLDPLDYSHAARLTWVLGRTCRALLDPLVK